MGSGASGGLCGGSRSSRVATASSSADGKTSAGALKYRAAGDDEESKSGLVRFAALVFRHGARGPGRSELKPFLDTDVEAQWAPEDIEELTAVGREQMRAVGRWFASYLLQGDGASLLQGDGDTIALAWGSSRVQRTVDSGACFLEGLKGEFAARQPKERRIDYGSDEATDDRFKAWNGGEFRKAFDAQVSDGDGDVGKAFASRARESCDLIRALCTRHGQATPPADATTDLVKLLRWMCYFHCMIEAERFWPTTATAGERGKLRSALSSEEIEGVEEMARWVWQRRFHTSGWGAVIGGTLLADLLRDLRLGLRVGEGNRSSSCSSSSSSSSSGNSEEGGNLERIGVYSGHDYTVLSLLTALGLRSYDQVLGFGAHLLLELVQGGGEGKPLTVRVSLNAVPFPEPQEEGGSSEASVRGKPTVVLEKPLAELEALSLKLQEEAAELLSKARAAATPAATT